MTRDTESPGAADSSLSAVEKSIALLRTIAGAGSEIGLSELARRVHLPKSTTYRVLGVLVDQRLVERRGTKYRLGVSAFELGAAASRVRSVNLRDRALPYLEELYELTHETVNLAVLDEHEVLYIEKLHGHRSTLTPSHVGGRLPASATALGKVLLAYSDGAQVARVMNVPLPALTKHTVVQPKFLVAELRRARRDGVAYDREGTRVGLCCVAAPLFVHGDKAVAAVSVSVSSSRFDDTRLSVAVTRTAALLNAKVMPSLDP